MIKILIVDDQLVVREKLKQALEKQPDFQVVGSAIDGDDAVRQVGIFRPDVVLLDIEMPVKDGLTAATEIRMNFPGTRTVILTSCDDVQSIRAALQNGAHGYLVKQQIDSSMMELIRSVSKGHMQFGPGLLEKVISQDALPLGRGRLQPHHDTFDSEITIDTEIANEAELLDIEFTPIDHQADWSNSAKEIIDGVPLPWTRGLFYCLLAFMAVAIPWAIFFQTQ
jgi:hemolysin D